MRPIDAEKLKAVYTQCYWEAVKKCGPESSEASIMAGVIKLLENMPTIERSEPPAAGPSWIPCSEDLPKTDEVMLVTAQPKKGAPNVNRAYYMSGSWHGSGSMANVTAWMPMPKPYEEKER